VSELAFGALDNSKMEFFQSPDGARRRIPNGVAMAYVYAGTLDDDGKFAKAAATLQRTLPPSVTPKIRAEVLDQVRLYLGHSIPRCGHPNRLHN
jgi:hypothetical protein